ncbi:MAG: hypothetical protein WDZ88_04370 [Candidatus Paceibacterota bacterium]
MTRKDLEKLPTDTLLSLASRKLSLDASDPEKVYRMALIVLLEDRGLSAKRAQKIRETLTTGGGYE